MLLLYTLHMHGGISCISLSYKVLLCDEVGQNALQLGLSLL